MQAMPRHCGILALASLPGRPHLSTPILQANFHTHSQPNVCVFHVHRILSLPERGTATCIPLNSSPPLLGFVYTRKILLFTEEHGYMLPRDYLLNLYCAACRGILTPMRATMARPGATRDPTAVSHRRGVRNTEPADPGCCVYTQDCLHTPPARESRGLNPIFTPPA